MMREHCTALLHALDIVGATQAELAKSLMRSDERRRHDLIAQRRALAEQTANVADLANALFDEAGDAALLARYRQLFSIARSKAALHQANWSAVRVGESEDDYRKSAREAGAAYRDLSDWMRDAIAQVLKR